MSHNRKDVEVTESSARFYKHKEVFIGHTSTFNWKCKKHLPEHDVPEQENKIGQIIVTMNRWNVWNMDTGGGYNGKVTIMDIKSKKLCQSDWCKELNPNKKERNYD